MANSTHIKWLLKGKSTWNAKRKSKNFRPDFSSSDIYEDFRKNSKLDRNGRVTLSGYDLAGANFEGATLKKVDLVDTNLVDANLTGLRLEQSQVWEAKLYQHDAEDDDAEANSCPAMNARNSISSVSELIEQCQEISEQDDELTLFFRGERDHRWKLYPSVMRPSRDKEFKLRPREGEMLRELISRRPEDFEGMTSALEQLVIAQHHGLRTRLLDVSRNPCVALFSACDARDSAGAVRRNDMDGMLHVFAVPQSLLRSFDSDTISIIANFAKLERHYQGLLLGKTMQAIIDEGADAELKPLHCEGMRRLYHFIRQEKPQFEEIIDPKDLFRVFIVEPMQSFERIRAQEGAFLISAFHEQFEHDVVSRNFKGMPIYNHHAFTVPQEKKNAILSELSLLNFTRETLYPSLDEVANAITRRFTSVREPTHRVREDFPGWTTIEDTGAGDGIPSECERCDELGTPREQFDHMGTNICFVCALKRAEDLESEIEQT